MCLNRDSCPVVSSPHTGGAAATSGLASDASCGTEFGADNRHPHHVAARGVRADGAGHSLEALAIEKRPRHERPAAAGVADLAARAAPRLADATAAIVRAARLASALGPADRAGSAAARDGLPGGAALCTELGTNDGHADHVAAWLLGADGAKNSPEALAIKKRPSRHASARVAGRIAGAAPRLAPAAAAVIGPTRLPGARGHTGR